MFKKEKSYRSGLVSSNNQLIQTRVE